MDRAKLLASIRLAEGFSPTPVPDSGGTVEVGYGRNLDTDPLTPAEAEVLLEGPVDNRIVAVTAALPWFEAATDARQRALVEMAYQMGTAGLLGFHDLLAAAANGAWVTAAWNVEHNADGSSTKLAIDTPARAARYAQMLRTGVD